jgi:hypothetical protein
MRRLRHPVSEQAVSGKNKAHHPFVNWISLKSPVASISWTMHSSDSRCPVAYWAAIPSEIVGLEYVQHHSVSDDSAENNMQHAKTLLRDCSQNEQPTK